MHIAQNFFFEFDFVYLINFHDIKTQKKKKEEILFSHNNISQR